MRRVLNLDRIHERLAEGCTITHLRGLLRFLGYTRPDAMMANEWAFFNTGEFQAGFLSAIRATSTDKFAGLRRLGFDAEIVTMSDPHAAWLIVREMIDNGFPVMAWVDEFELPYVREAKLKAGKHTVDDHYVHNLLIYGYEDDQLAWVMDRGYKMGPIKVSDLKAARSSKEAWPWDAYGDDAKSRSMSLENPYLALTIPKGELPFIDAYSLYIAEAVRHAATIADERSVLKGPRGMEEFARDLASRSHLMEDMEARFLDRALVPVVVERRLGGAVFRTAAELHSPEPWTTISKHATDIYRSWLECQLIVTEAWRKRTFSRLNELSTLILGLADKERRFYDQLSSANV